ncbi:MAG: GTP-binding protein [Promethearchaeota archaeon]
MLLIIFKRSREGETLERCDASASVTIKSANISLLHKVNNNRYVVNLIDTPGHVDFGGKVTRAMRAIDGAIIVVDAVEEVMAQTESVLRTAIKESVRPVLFINKIDRLFRELKLRPKQIQEKLTRIISQINDLINERSSPQSDVSWQVNDTQGSVAFGSALHKWGFTIQQMREAGLRFNDIIRYYNNNEIEELAGHLPIHKPVLEMILTHLPSPREAQSYRISHIWKGETDSPASRALRKCEKDGPLIMCITKLVDDPRNGNLAVARVLSGTVRRGTTIKLLPRKTQSIVQRVSLFMGSRRVTVPALTAGNICGLSGLQDARAGDTVTGIDVPKGMVPFEDIRYINEPVVTISVEARRPRELPRLLSYLDILTKRDPNLVFRVNEETGEYLLSGIGILHLEIIIRDIKEAGIDVISSEPIVLYQETPEKPAALEQKHFSPNTRNSIRIAVRSLALSTNGTRDVGQESLVHDQRNNILVNEITESDIPESVKAALKQGFIWACERGPLCGEPMGSTYVQIIALELSDHQEERGRVELMSMMKDAIFKVLNDSGMTLLEPNYEIQVLVPSDLLQKVTSIIQRKRGKIKRVEHKGKIVTVQGTIPVSETLDLATTMRSATSGRAQWQTQFGEWSKVSDNRIEQIVSEILKRKGWRNL